MFVDRLEGSSPQRRVDSATDIGHDEQRDDGRHVW